MNANYRSAEKRVLSPVRVRQLRGESTDAERALWRLLRGRNLQGVKFRRQHQYGPFVLDFFAPEAKLAIEVDGGQHYSDAAAARDAERTEFLKRNGIAVLRFSNAEVMNETAAVAEAIAAVLAGRPPHPRPLPEGEGD